MKIKYEFATGDVTEIEVEDSIGEIILESRRLGIQWRPQANGTIAIR